MPIQILNGVRSLPGSNGSPQRGSSKVFPKAGRLGSGAYYPGAPNSPRIQGNPFGPNQEPVSTRTSTAAPREFGSRSNAGNGTTPFDSRVTVGASATHPNSGFRNISKQNRVMAISTNTGGRVESPYGVNPVVQPHERNQLHHKKQRTVHHTAFGASNILPSDTAFQRRPATELPRNPRRPQQFVLREQFDTKTGLPNSGGTPFTHKSADTFTPSFVSHNQLWTDPNNSFYGGASNALGQGTGKGRWAVVKHGAAG